MEPKSHLGWNHICSQWWKNSVLFTQAGTTSAHNDGRFPHFHPGWNHIHSQWWKTLIQAWAPPTIVMRDLCTHIWPGRNWILHPHQNGPQSLTELPGNRPGASTLPESGSFPYICPTRQNGQHSHLSWEELNPLAMNRMSHPLYLTYSS